MMRAPWATHFGFTKLPFSKSVLAKDLLDRASHQEAVARIRFCIAEALLGVITGEVGVGSVVEIEDENGERMEMEISSVGGAGTVSPDSPLGRALVGQFRNR